MSTSKLILLVAVVAVVSVLGGALGGYVEMQREDAQYHEGVALLEGSGGGPSPDAQGIAVIKIRPKETILKVQLSGAPEAANTALTIKIATTPLADAVVVGTLNLDARGKGSVTIIETAGQPFPNIIDGSEITLKTAADTKVVEGVFGAPATSGGGGAKVGGPGYPTGPLDTTISAAQLILDRVGAVKPGEIRDRQYEANGVFPITINGAAYSVTSLKVISNLKIKNGIGQHGGTIDIDKDTLPGFHLTLQYNGTATVVGNTITSSGTFKTSKATGSFAGLVAEGNYTMTIVESAQTLGAPATVTINTVSLLP